MSKESEAMLSQKAGSNAQQYQSAGNMTVNNYNGQPKSYKQYLKLVEEFEKELENGDIEFKEFIDKIQHYTATIDGFVGLDPKLQEAGFQDDIPWAQQMKEYYYKKITENNLSKATQKIHAFLLARVCVLFNLHIKGAVNDGVSKEVIREMIIEKVIHPIQDMLGENNVLDLYDDDITAMIYFLTGNCHIRWK
jgi:hypothetical protein